MSRTVGVLRLWVRGEGFFSGRLSLLTTLGAAFWALLGMQPLLASGASLGETPGTRPGDSGRSNTSPYDHRDNHGRYIVVLIDSVEQPGRVAETQTNQRQGNLGFVYRSALRGYSASDLSKSDVAALRSDPRVKYVVPDGRVEVLAQTVPTGISRTLATENKALDIDGVDDVRINADVAVLDTGIDYTHPDLSVVSRINCVPPDEESSSYKFCASNSGTDGDGHGTHVAGTIGAIDNEIGVVGVAPGVRLWAIRVLDNKGSGWDSWILAGIDWVTAQANNIEVANMSLGGEGKLPAMEAAIDASINAGVVYTVAAGNEETNAEWQHPANDPDVITVSALSDNDGKPGGTGAEKCWGPDDTLARFSNWGGIADIAAPGTCIYSTWKGGEYAFDSGTSMASPHVAGAAAILASKANPGSRTDVETIRNTLVRSGSLDWLDTSNDGRAEPVLYIGENTLADIEVATGGYTSDGESATLYGSVNPRDLPFEYYFEYGQTTEYGQKASLNPAKVGVGTKYQLVNQSIRGLQPEHLYHYRLVVKTESGTIYGKDHSFRTSLWSVQSPSNIPAGEAGEWLNDVSCGALGSCMAVGYYYYGDNLMSSFELSGGQWTYRDVPEPAAPNVEGFPMLDGISCTAANACTAVGKVQLEGGVVVTLAERWNGSNWSIQTTPSPAGSPYARLQDVSCVSSAECIAVGYYKNTSGVWVNLSARWKNGTWSLLTTPNIEGTTESELRSVSCASATFCMAVGRSEGPRKPLTMIWNGTSWTLQKGARESGWLSEVSCTSSQFCMAVTAYPYAEVWNGESWSTQNWALPSGGEFIWLNSVSCSTSSFCRASGEVYKESRLSSFSETWSNGTWKAQVGSRKVEAGNVSWGVSCQVGFGCASVGGERVGPEDIFIETYRNVSTSPPAKVGATKATLNGVVNPEGMSTSYHFEYGLTTSYGTSIPLSDASVGSGHDPVEVSQELTELPAETTYHYRIVASNEKGVYYGADKVFRTGTVAPSQTQMFGYYGTANGLFDRPKGIGVDSEGNIWVVDGYNNRVQKFNSKGEFLLKFGSAGSGSGQFSTPMDVAFTADGKVWVTDSGNARVQQFDSTGKYLGQFGSYGTAAGKLVYPKGIAIGPDGHIWVTDHLYRRVQEFSASGSFIRAVGAVGDNGNGQTSFSYPDGIAIGADGRVWVADRHNDKVKVLSSTGQLLNEFGTEGEGLGDLQEPSAIDIKPSGDVVVTDRTLGRIQQFDPSWNFVTKFGRGDWWVSEQEGIAAAPHGVVYVAQGTASGFEKWQDPSPEVVTSSSSGVSAEEATLSGFVNPRGLPSSYHFEYGLTTSYGTRVPQANASVGAGTSAVSVSQLVSGLSPGTTYHYRLVATNGEMTAFGNDQTFTTAVGTAVQLAGMAVTEPFNASSSAVSDFASDWTALGWATGTPAKGENTASGWRPVAAFPAVNGASYSSVVTDTGQGIAAAATMAANPEIASRYFSVWLDLPTPASARTGYELRLTFVSTGKYDVSLSKWVGGSQTVLASKPGVSFVNGNSLALVDRGSTVSGWIDIGSGFSQLIAANDSAFSSGSAAIEGSGNITRLTKVKVGTLLTPVANMDAALKELTLVDSFANNETPLSSGGAWSALSWANGGSGNNTGRVSGGWGPYDAFSAINGAYWTKATMPDTGAGTGVTATLLARPANTSRYFSLWLDMPNPASVRAGYELRFTETASNVYDVVLSTWQAGSKTALATKTGYSFPVNSLFGLVDKGATVSAWTRTGSGYSQLLSAGDSTFKTGYIGVEGSGNITRLGSFRGGPLAPF